MEMIRFFVISLMTLGLQMKKSGTCEILLLDLIMINRRLRLRLVHGLVISMKNLLSVDQTMRAFVRAPSAARSVILASHFKTLRRLMELFIPRTFKLPYLSY